MPNARPRMELPSQTEYNKLLIANYTQGGVDLNRDASVVATAGYFGAAARHMGRRPYPI